MRRIITVLVAVLMTVSVFAQAPQKMSYQAVVRNASNALVINTPVGMRISILQNSSSGTAVYVETLTPSTNANGLVSLEIGTGTQVTGSFGGIDWTDGPYFIQTETDPTGGTNYTISGTSQLLSVPYALHAKTAESITGTITETDPLYTNSQAAHITATDITNLSNLSGTNTGDQDLSALATTTALTTGLASKVDKATGKDLLSNGTTAGQMNYWNGTAWVTIAPGTNGQSLVFCHGVPVWGTCILAIGDSYQGGIVAYLLQPGDPGYSASVQHGLIASANNLTGGSGQWWNGSYTTTGATGTALGTGMANTTAIIASQGNTGTYAAKLCRDYTDGVYTDWYLPSKDELNKLYLNRVAIGGFGNGDYWSSTEVNSNLAINQYFLNGTVGSGSDKAASFPGVRAVRSF